MLINKQTHKINVNVHENKIKRNKKFDKQKM